MAEIKSLTDADRTRISQAVAEAERHTAGELVTIITEQSDSYHDIALAWAAFAAFLALTGLIIAPEFYAGLWDRITGGWAISWTMRAVLELALLITVLKFFGVWLLLQWRPLRFLLTPRGVQHARVRGRAVTCFKVGAERRTHGRTGVLIYLSIHEHRAEIVADEAIAGKVDPEVWGEAMSAMLGPIRDGRMGDGLIAGVEQVGAVLAQHFPRHENDINELPDRLIEV